MEQFSDELVEHYKNDMSARLNEKFVGYYLMATEPPFNALFTQPKSMGIILLPFTLAGVAIDFAKSPLVGVVHGGMSAAAKISSSSRARNVLNFLTDSSKRGALLDIGFEDYNQNFHLSVIDRKTGSYAPSNELYEIHDKILSTGDYYDYLRTLDREGK